MNNNNDQKNNYKIVQSPKFMFMFDENYFLSFSY